MPYADPELEKARKQRHYQNNKDVVLARNRAWAKANPEVTKAHNARYREKNYEQVLWSSAKTRATRSGATFTISKADVVLARTCPILGVELDYSSNTKSGKPKPNSPTLDRRVPALGYVPGNVQVISFRANTIKSNATPEELRKVADYVWAMS